MGVPTANLDLAGVLTPPSGVYAARALVRGGSHPAAVNIGCRPTVASGGAQSARSADATTTSGASHSQAEAQPPKGGTPSEESSGGAQIQVEAHLLDFAGDIYGEEVELAFLKKLREERKFASLAALREQILRDIARARELSGDV
jgi:riboflavin kinase/FMN adenylyltransferase